jgi:maltooligosyltrehalose trehalohydrolase
VRLILESPGQAREISLEREADGYYGAAVSDVGHRQRYWYELDGRRFPDPASRWQPEGVFGPSEIVDPSRFTWTDGSWRGIALDQQILYEMHVGTFTQDGTWRAAIERLSSLVDIGITVVEVMPVAEFPGQFGWGYDGVFPYAPTRLYGTPDDFRAFVDRAHALGLAVILDVVYNHLGPDGCVFGEFATDYYTRRYENEWGDALNFDGPNAGPVRDYFSDNAAYWIADYHLDGLRLDATQTIHDNSSEHILGVIARKARAAAGGRGIIIVSENESQQVRLVQPVTAGGYGLDALWNDDFHHSAVVTLTGRREAYYSDHRGTPQELISAAKHGFLFQGQRYAWQKKGRGSRTDGAAPKAFITFIENHDQVANSGDGSRLHQRSAPGAYRAMTALLLLMPATPMLFQGQEFGASAPFLYFADHNPELAAAVARGRAEFVSQFPTLSSPAAQARLPVPHDTKTFERCKLQWREHETNVQARRLHRDLIALRRSTRAFNEQRAGALDGAVLSDTACVLRFAHERPDEERLLVLNFGTDLTVPAFPEPLVAPPADRAWATAWSSEDPAYGGVGAADVCGPMGWHVLGLSATVLKPVEASDERRRENGI